MEPDPNYNQEIVDLFRKKAILKQTVYDNTFEVMNMLKDSLEEYVVEANEMLEDAGKRIKMEYRDRGKHEVQLILAGDTLVFAMHTNIFLFDREHPVWENDYAKSNPDNAYCGVINIYNFLSDSFRYNRDEDEGYLIGRIFVNHEKKFLVEGKRQSEYRVEYFGKEVISENAIIKITENAIEYSLEFDLLVPKFETVKIVEAEQMNTKAENLRIKTSKRLGYKYNTDDV